MADFRQLQQQWTAWLRQPEHQPAPEGIDARRLAIYRELLFNNVCGFVNNAFPISQKHIKTADWQQLLVDFFAQHRCQSPLFYEIAYEFLTFVMTQPQWVVPYPWLVELAHFEWTALAAEGFDAALPRYVAGNLLENVPVVNPCAWPLVYRWPVHTFTHTEPTYFLPEQPTCLILYRDVSDHVGYIEANPLTCRLVEKLQDNQQKTGRQLLTELAVEQGLPALALQAAGEHIVEVLFASAVVLGVKPT